MISLAIVLTTATGLAWAAARCPLGRAIGIGMSCLAEASRSRRGALD